MLDRGMLFCLFLAFLSAKASADGCNDSCQKTYSLHTAPLTEELYSCQRGCRFYSLASLTDSFSTAKLSNSSCFTACDKSYEGFTLKNACNIGCELEFEIEHEMEENFNSFLIPSWETPFDLIIEDSSSFPSFVSFERMFSRMCDEMTRMKNGFMWNDFRERPLLSNLININNNYMDDSEQDTAFILLDENNNSVGFLETHIIRSFPQEEDEDSPFIKGWSGPGGMGKRQQFYPWLKGADSITEPSQSDGNENTTWISCITRRTGLPRWATFFVLSFSITVFLWIILVIFKTAPKQKVFTVQKSHRGRKEGEEKKPKYLLMISEEDMMSGEEEKKKMIMLDPPKYDDVVVQMPKVHSSHNNNSKNNNNNNINTVID